MAGSLLPFAKQIALDNSANPGNGWKFFTYEAGTLTPKATYQDSALTEANTNPVVANGRGEVTMYGSGSYRVILKDSNDVTIWDRDNIAPASQLFDVLSASDGASRIGFSHSQAYAAGSLGSKMKDWVSVKDAPFGAKGDGVTDDTAAIQSAISASQYVYFPPGTYITSDVLTINRIVYLYGAGAGVSILKQTVLTKGCIKFDLNYAQGGGISGLTIKANTATAQAQGSTGIGLQVINSNDNFICRDFEVMNFDKGIRVDGCYQPRFDNFRILYFTDYGVYHSPDLGTSASQGAGAVWKNGKISNFGFTGTNTASIGIWLQQASGEFFDTVDVTTANMGVLINPPTGSSVRYLFMSKVLGDSCLTNNWKLDATGGGTIVANEYSQCWSSNSQEAGVVYVGANINTQKWIGGWIRDSGYEGIYINGGDNSSFIGTEITRNSARATLTYHGARFGPNAQSFKLFSCRIGNVSTTVNTSEHLDNIHIDAGAQQGFQIIGCDLNNPGTGGQYIANGSSSFNWIICNNLPIQNANVNASGREALSVSSNTTVASNTGGYLGPAGFVGTSRSSPHVRNKPGIVTGFYVGASDAPGVGETFTYKVMKNAVATGMTGTISGSGQFTTSPTSGQFTVNVGDELTLELVTSLGATPTYHRGYITVEP